MAVILAVLYALVAVLVHAAWCRLPPAIPSVPKYVMVAALLGIGLIAHLFVAYGVSTALLAGVLVYGLLIELYLFMATLIISSVSAIWLRRLWRGSARLDALRELYSPAWMVESRIERLVSSGFVVQAGSDFRVTAKGLHMIQTFGRFRRFFRHAPR
jgi:hypothetical protein